ncbi:MAG: hypothetical protein ACRD3D_07270 [Terriglobia bacterium]
MAKEAQQQTLSIRVPDDLRIYLENTKKLISNAVGEFVSVSDVAKTLLERAKTDRIDDLVELPELFRAPTESLVRIRRKWEQKQMLSRGEWILLAYYVQQGCECFTGDLALPSGDSLAQLLDAFLALTTALRKPAVREDFYLKNLALEPHELPPSPTPKGIVEAIHVKQERLRDARWSAGSFQFSRSFYVALMHEEFKSVDALNGVLTPFLPTLYRLAARGHWLAEKAPVRYTTAAKDYGFVPVNIPTVKLGNFVLTTLVADDGDLAAALNFLSRNVTCPMGPYPQIRDLWTTLKRLRPGEQWTGHEFFAYTDAYRRPEAVTECYFRHRVNGIIFGFSTEEWRQLGKVFDRLFALPELKPVLDELSLQYGEL